MMSFSNLGQKARVYTHMMAVKQRRWKPFIQQTHNPQAVQQALLKRILAMQACTAFGEKHQFARLRSYDEFRLGVPIHTYEDLRPYLQAQEDTKELQLNGEHPVSYALTSGTTGKPKFIPILSGTNKTLRHFQCLSTYAQFIGVPKIFEGKMLCVTGQEVEGYLESGTAYGSMSGLLVGALPAVLRAQHLLPEAIHGITDYQQKYLRLATWALSEPNLSVVATANPSTFLKLLDVGRLQFPQIIENMELRRNKASEDRALVPRVTKKRLRYLQSFVGREDELTMEALWPDLQAVVTWTGGSCGLLLSALQSRLPEKTAIVEMGYLSSEFLGSVNVDVRMNQCVPTFYGNFFEFVEQKDWDAGRPHTVTLEGVETGKRYYIIVTTMNGLYRYFMNDLIEVTGWFHQTPTIQFVQKGKGVTNLTGEKLYEFHVMDAVQAIQQVYQTSFDFYVMLADPLTLQYTLYLEHRPLDFFVGHKLEEQIGELNLEFKSKRASGRLQPLRVVYLQEGTAEAYKAHCLELGQRDAQFKVLRLQYAKDCPFNFDRYARG